MNRYFVRIWKQFRFILKRERFSSTTWLASLVMITAIVALAYANLFSTPEELQSMVLMFKNPAMIAMLGPLYGLDNLTIGGLFSGSMLLFTIIVVSIMNIFLVVRHTREDEEKGRVEVIRSLPVGRLSGLGATMAMALVINFLLAFLTGIVLSILGIGSIGFAGAMLYGAALGVSGLFFACLTAILCQIFTHSRNAIGASLAVIALLYVIRAFGDIGYPSISIVSPLGLILRTECFVRNIWWPVLIVFCLSLILGGIAFLLNLIRDTDQGLIPQRQGRGKASWLLKSHYGLAFRLLRNFLLAWGCSLLFIGAVYGSVMGDMESFIVGNEFLSNILIPPPGHSQTEMFMTMLNSLLAIASAIPALGTILKLANEERNHRYDNIISKKISRSRIMSDYLVLALFISTIMLFCAMFGLWLASSVVMEEKIAFGSLFAAMMVYLPAIWMMIAIAVLLIGLVPEKASLCSYIYLGFSFFILYLGRILSFPGWVKYLTPFGYIPQLPVDTVNFLTLSLLVLAGVSFMTGGYYFYRKRDSL